MDDEGGQEKAESAFQPERFAAQGVGQVEARGSEIAGKRAFE